MNEGKPRVVMLLPIRFDINVRLCRVANSHVDSVTPFRSMVLSCQRTPYLININFVGNSSATWSEFLLCQLSEFVVSSISR